MPVEPGGDSQIQRTVREAFEYPERGFVVALARVVRRGTEVFQCFLQRFLPGLRQIAA